MGHQQAMPACPVWRHRGGIYVYTSSGHTSTIFSLVVLAAGLVAFFVWARRAQQWPFGPEYVHEDFLEAGDPDPATVTRQRVLA